MKAKEAATSLSGDGGKLYLATAGNEPVHICFIIPSSECNFNFTKSVRNGRVRKVSGIDPIRNATK